MTGVSAIFWARASSLFTADAKLSRMVSDAIVSCCSTDDILICRTVIVYATMDAKEITKKRRQENTKNVLFR
jgi:hypothetical protein